jgi:hypothetical protein
MENPCKPHDFSVRERVLAVLFGTTFSCKRCQRVFGYSRGWLNLMTFVEITSFFFAAASSIIHRSYWPYVAWVLFLALCTWGTCKFIPVRAMAPIRWRHSITNFLLLIVFMWLLIHVERIFLQM